MALVVARLRGSVGQHLYGSAGDVLDLKPNISRGPKLESNRDKSPHRVGPNTGSRVLWTGAGEPETTPDEAIVKLLSDSSYCQPGP